MKNYPTFAPPNQVNNDIFLRAIFGTDHLTSHCASFIEDPSNLPQDLRGRCWGGFHYHGRTINEGNQYFTISRFSKVKGRAVRQKAHFIACYVIVADDVKEKVPVEQANLLPPPSYKLLTSAKSEQWGWILSEPCYDRSQVENLLEGLVTLGLSPTGTDPGMVGATRYVRLPDGYNSKSSRLVDGRPFKCRLLEFTPTNRYSMEDLALPFGVDLARKRTDAEHPNAVDVEDHPIFEAVKVKSKLGPGKYDIVCPWIEEHTGGEDSGSVLWTHKDFSIGFKCHHGHCEGRKTHTFIKKLEKISPGIESKCFLKWVGHLVGHCEPVELVPRPPPSVSPIDEMLKHLLTLSPGEASDVHIFKILQSIDNEEFQVKKRVHDEIRKFTKWTKIELKNIIKEQQYKWFIESEESTALMDECVFVGGLNKFFHKVKREFYSPEAYENMYGHRDVYILKTALKAGQIKKVDRTDYRPEVAKIFKEGPLIYVNQWSQYNFQAKQGDISPWWYHFDKMGIAEHREHIVNWMAYTLQHPGTKINHALILAGAQGVGKDFLFAPLLYAFGKSDSCSVRGDVLQTDFNEYLPCKKFIMFNETALGDVKEAKKMAERFKELAASPPNELRVNQKHIGAYEILNIVNIAILSNSAHPVNLGQELSRRFYAVWSKWEIDSTTSESKAYFKPLWHWHDNEGGWQAVIYYLLNKDISDFDPRGSPPRTEFQEEMQEMSADPIAMILKEMINARVGSFIFDIVTFRDIVKMLANPDMTGRELKAIPSNGTIGKIFKQNSIGLRHRTENVVYWTIRNQEKYEKMTPAEIKRLYIGQVVPPIPMQQPAPNVPPPIYKDRSGLNQ